MWTHKGDELIISVSGGKDSTATALFAKENNWDFKNVFADTGWEHPTTYDYINYLETIIGPINKVKKTIEVKEEHLDFVKYIENQIGYSSFVRMIINKTCIPNRIMKFCTPILKVEPIKNWVLENTNIPVVAIGIRKDESLRRSKLEKWEFSDLYDSWIWRPILNFTIDEVIKIHKKHNVKPNYLYLKNHNRVGCYPCIFGNKKNIKTLDSQRIKIIKEIEDYISKCRGYEVNFFRGGNIHRMYEWSKTSHGGKQFELFDMKPQSCEKWGLCINE